MQVDPRLGQQLALSHAAVRLVIHAQRLVMQGMAGMWRKVDAGRGGQRPGADVEIDRLEGGLRRRRRQGRYGGGDGRRQRIL